MAQLQFTVRNQIIRRTDFFHAVSDSQNYLKAQFKFGTPEWNAVEKTAVFKRVGDSIAYKMLLDTEGVCQVPNEVLVGDSGFTVSVYAEKLNTVNTALVDVDQSGFDDAAEGSETGENALVTTKPINIPLLLSGYAEEAEPTPDVYQQILERLHLLEYLTVLANLLPAGSPATVEKSVDTQTGGYVFTFGIPKGDQGETGNGISHAVLNADYTLTLFFTNGTSYTTASIRGAQGAQGIPGVSPTVTVTDITGGHRVTITDAEHPGGVSFDVMDGGTGNGISSAVLNQDYTLTLNFTDGTSYTTSSIRGEKGEKGDTGEVASLNSIAPDYSTSSTYAVGDYCTHNDLLYVCKTAISTAEAWTAAHWTRVDVTSLLSDLNDSLNSVESDLDNLIDVSHTDLLYGKTAVEKWFVNNNTGVGTSNGSFYSYENIVIPDGIKKLWPYNEFTVGGEPAYYIRSVCFYDSGGDFISGVSGNSGTVTNGIAVPATSKTLSCSLTYAAGATKGTHYLSTEISGDIVTKDLNPDINVAVDFNNNNIRIPCINFQFDDGADKDADIVTIFNQFSMKCGFALLSSITPTNARRYLGYQNNGYEILCHADSGTAMSDATVDPATIEQRLKSSKEILETLGFKIKGFVTPDSTMASVFKPLLRKYYQWAETVYYGSYSGSGKAPYMRPFDGVYNGWRVSLQSTTLANQKLAVDNAINNYGCLTFYGHASSLDTTDNFTTANLTELLTYIAQKVNSGKCVIGTPSEVIRNYFDVRNDDVFDGWVEVSSTQAELDIRFSAANWYMAYNDNLKLMTVFCRVAPTEDVPKSGYDLFKFPRSPVGAYLIQNEGNIPCIAYDGKCLLQGSGTWVSGTNYRFSAMMKIQ